MKIRPFILLLLIVPSLGRTTPLGFGDVPNVGTSRLENSIAWRGRVVKDRESAVADLASSVVEIYAYVTEEDENGELTVKKSYICSGSVISEHAVLTSGHCAVSDRYEVRFHNRWTGEKFVRQVTARAVGDLRYDSDRREAIYASGDVLMLKIDGGVPSGIPPAKFAPAEDASIFAGDEVLVFGYGKQSFSSRDGSLRVLRMSFSGFGTLGHMMLDQIDGAVCPGDSGGPVFFLYRGAYYQIGVTSRGQVSTRCVDNLSASNLYYQHSRRADGTSWFQRASRLLEIPEINP